MLIWQAAEHNAQVVRDDLARRGVPFSLENVCESLDIDILYTPNLAPGTSGMIIKRQGEDRTRIYINANEVETRQRFTIAHEIGHFIERMTTAADEEFSFTDSRGTSYDLHEFYADQFAGALLMPEDEVREITPDLNDSLQVALKFGVSIPAATKRLQRLKKQADHYVNG